MEKQRYIITDIIVSRWITNRSALWGVCQSKGMTRDFPLPYFELVV